MDEEKRVIGIDDLDMSYTELIDRMLPKMKRMSDTVNNDEDALFKLQMATMVNMLINDLEEIGDASPHFLKTRELIDKTDFFAYEPYINGFFVALLSLWKLSRQGEVELSDTLMNACVGAFELLAYMDVVVKTGKYKKREW